MMAIPSLERSACARTTGVLPVRYDARLAMLG